jgi:hypothetical protein
MLLLLPGQCHYQARQQQAVQQQQQQEMQQEEKEEEQQLQRQEQKRRPACLLRWKCLQLTSTRYCVQFGLAGTVYTHLK